MAQLIGISRQAYINLEKGKTALINKQIIKMAEKCGMTEEEILFGPEITNNRQSGIPASLINAEHQHIVTQNRLIDELLMRIDMLTTKNTQLK